MNILDFIAKLLLSTALACVISILLSMFITMLLGNIGHFFEWNHNRDMYWIFNVSIITLVLTWILSFGYFMSTIK
jgi:hypothetical protein